MAGNLLLVASHSINRWKHLGPEANPMSNARRKPEPFVLRVQTRAPRSFVLEETRCLLFLAFALCCAGALHAEEPFGTNAPVADLQGTNAYAAAVQKYLAETSSHPLPAIDPHEVAARIAEFESALTNRVQTMEQPVQIAEAPPPAENHNTTLFAVAIIFAGAFALRKTVQVLNGGAGRWLPVPATAADSSANLLAEEPSLIEFFRLLRAGPSVHASQIRGELPVVEDPLQKFFDFTANYLANMLASFSRISSASSEAARQKIFFDLYHQVQFLKESAQLPQLVPFVQVAAGLEGLLKQVSGKASNVTPSAIRTAAGAMNLLEAFCAQSFKPSPDDDSLVRLLVVDDDAISRHAMCVALRKAFVHPDLAPDGQAALALVNTRTYDVIFLDVEMPNMDGFEVCLKIHETDLNRTTPVVFVTRHSDFNSRAKSNAIGAQDLIGKPFLAFEIAVKTLTLVWRARLKRREAESRSAPKEPAAEIAPAPADIASGTSSVPPAPVAIVSGAALSAEKLSETSARQKEPAGSGTPSSSPLTSVPGQAVSLAVQPASSSSAVLLETTTNDFADAYFNHAAADLEQLRNHLHAARKAADPAEFHEPLSLVYVGVHTLLSEVKRADLSAFIKLFSALEGMLKKLIEHPRFCNPSTLEAAGSALELAQELCRTRSNPDLALPAPRLLVVDDDPIACRALSGALQLTFGKPSSAASGEAALALAAASPFDLVFLDVRMPGMDGFETCSKLHETAANSVTPVVFVTSHDDKDSRSQAALAGGCGFIPKPILSSQITLVALTFILRNRVSKQISPVETLVPQLA